MYVYVPTVVMRASMHAHCVRVGGGGGGRKEGCMNGFTEVVPYFPPSGDQLLTLLFVLHCRYHS